MLYSINSKEIKLFGLINEGMSYNRLPESLMSKLPALSFLGRHPVGGRIAFRTNAASFKIKCEYVSITMDYSVALASGSSLLVYRGSHKHPLFMGAIYPHSYNENYFEKEFKKSTYMENIMIFLNRNEEIKSLIIEIPDGAKFEIPDDYEYKRPVCYFGSSVTEGLSTTLATNSYPAIISRHLDCDYYNLGFGGAPILDLAIADFLATINLSAIVLDLDQYSYDIAYLAEAHERFFKRIRAKAPALPIILMSAPRARYKASDKKRKNIIKDTYIEALASGDKHVYYVDGEELYNEDGEFATTDGINPNDLGCYNIAIRLEERIRELLEESRSNG